MKQLTERFQAFKKLYNGEIIKVYKDTKEIVQKYEDRLRKHNLPLDESEQSQTESESESQSDSETEEKKGDAKTRKSKSTNVAANNTVEYECPAKVINSTKVKAGSIVIKRQKKRETSSDSSDSEEECDKSKISKAQSNMKKRDAIARGDPIDKNNTSSKRGPGRPKMTSSEKEAAREKRRQDKANGVEVPDARDDSQAPQKRKYRKSQNKEKSDKPIY